MPPCHVKESRARLTLRNRFSEVAVDLKTGTWSARDRKNRRTVIKDASFCVTQPQGHAWAPAQTDITWARNDFNSVHGKGTAITITCAPREGYEPTRMLIIRLFNEKPFIELGWGIRNRFDYPVRIKHVYLARDGGLFEGEDVKHPRVLRSGAGAEPNLVEKGWRIEALNGALLTYLDGSSRRSMVAGGLAYSEFARRVELLDSKRTWGVRGTARQASQTFPNVNLVTWDPQGKLVAPRTTYLSPDTFYVDFVTTDPFEAAENYGRALRDANHAKPNPYDFPTLCGWMVSTTGLGEGKPINHSPGLVEQARLAKDRGFMNYSPLAVRLEPDTYCYENFGDTQQGWWDDEHWSTLGPGGGSARGPEKASLRKPYETFSKFCKAVSDLGAIPFTYFQCGMPSNDFAVAHPDWMLNNDISELHRPHPHHRPLVRYDYTDPGFRAHCLQVWKRLRKAGLKGIKFDYPESAWIPSGGFEDPRFTTTSAYRELYRLCREGLGEEAFIHERNLGGVTHEDAPRLDATAGIVDLQRVWGDASHFEAEMASRIGLRWYKSRRVFLYYPDGKSFYAKGKPLPAFKRRAFLTLIAFLSGRLEIGTSIGSMTEEMYHELTRVFPVLGGARSPRPVDMLTGKKHPEVYAYPVNDEWCQVLLINNNKSGRKTITVPLSGDSAETGALGLPSDSRYHAFEFWAQQYLGELDGADELAVSRRGGEVAMISLRRVADRPQIISTNRHYLQGMMECHNEKWNKRWNVLRGEVDVVAGETFVLTIACNGHKPVSCEGASLRDHAERKELIELLFESQKNQRCTYRLKFA